MNTDIPKISTVKAKEFGEKLTVALKERSYERLEEAAEAFVGLFEGENIVAIDKFIEHVKVVYNGLNSYYDRERIITLESLNDSRERRRWSPQNSSDKDHDQHLHE